METFETVCYWPISGENPHKTPQNHIAISYETKINTTDEDVEKGSVYERKRSDFTSSNKYLSDVQSSRIHHLY